MSWWKTILGPGPRQVWREARQAYNGDSLKAATACLLTVSVVIVPFWVNWVSRSDPFQGTGAYSQDYSVLAVWLIIVPISFLSLVWYRLRLKPALLKRRVR